VLGKTIKITTKKRSARARIARPGAHGEHRFDYARSRPNRFAPRMAKDVVAVVLDPDVASAFPTSAEVNTALRSMIGNGSPRPRP